MSEHEVTDPALLQELQAKFGQQSAPASPMAPPQAVPVPGPAIARQSPMLPVRPTMFGQGDPRSSFYQAPQPYSDDPAQRFAEGAGAFLSDTGLRGQQLFNWIQGRSNADTESAILEKRQLDRPLLNTMAGRLGYGAPATLAGIVTGGAADLAGAGMSGPALSAGYGTVLGAMQPTTSQDMGGNFGQTALNMAIGGGTAYAGARATDALSEWAKLRAQEPVGGVTERSAQRMTARAVGSDAPRLNQEAIADATDRLGNVFNKYRSPDVMANVGETSGVIDNLASNLDDELVPKFNGSLGVKMATRMATDPSSTASTEELGHISSELGKAARAQYNSNSGNPQLARAYTQLRDHIEGLIESQIPSPSGVTEYQMARRQYGALQDLRYNPSLLNATTGEPNPKSIGNYLQRKSEFSGQPIARSPLAVLGQWGQRTGAPSEVPSMLHPLEWARYRAIHNPVFNIAGGLASRGIVGAGPLFQYGLPAASAAAGDYVARESPAVENFILK